MYQTVFILAASFILHGKELMQIYFLHRISTFKMREQLTNRYQDDWSLFYNSLVHYDVMCKYFSQVFEIKFSNCKVTAEYIHNVNKKSTSKENPCM